MSEFTCKKCFHKKPETDFHKNKKSKTGYNTMCKDCKNSLNKTYLTQKKVASNEKTRKYFEYKLVNMQEQDKRKFPDYVSILTVDDLINIYTKYNKTCIYSRKPLRIGSKVNIYAKVSFDRIDNNKPHEKDNLQLTSVFMNMFRGELTSEEFNNMLTKYDN